MPIRTCLGRNKLMQGYTRSDNKVSRTRGEITSVSPSCVMSLWSRQIFGNWLMPSLCLSEQFSKCSRVGLQSSLLLTVHFDCFAFIAFTLCFPECFRPVRTFCWNVFSSNSTVHVALRLVATRISRKTEYHERIC